MTFTWDSSLSTDLAKVRFHIGDTTAAGAFLADETINYWIGVDSSLGEAIVHCIQYIISQLSTPQFSADGFSISTTDAIASFQLMLKQKQQEFGISNTSAKCSIKHAHRADSLEYSDELNADGLHYDDPSGGD